MSSIIEETDAYLSLGSIAAARVIIAERSASTERFAKSASSNFPNEKISESVFAGAPRPRSGAAKPGVKLNEFREFDPSLGPVIPSSSAVGLAIPK